MVALNFDARQVAPAQPGGAILPVSDEKGHVVVISSSEGKPVRDGGQNEGFLELTLTIIQGPFQGQSGPFRLNIWNDSPKAVEIAFAQLSAICHVTQTYNINDTAQLYNKPFRVIVVPQIDKLTGKPNENGYTNVKGILDINGNAPGKSGSMQPAPAAPAPATYAPTAQPAQNPPQPAYQPAPTGNAAYSPPNNGGPPPPATAWSAPAPAQQPQPNNAAPQQQPPWSQQR